MAKEIKVTWIARQLRYTKLVKGKRWYSPRGLTDSAADHRKAVKLLLEWIEDQDKTPPRVKSAIDRFRKVGDHKTADDLESRAAKGEPLNSIDLQPYNHSDQSRAVFAHKLQMAEDRQSQSTINQAIEQFLAYKKTKVGNGQIVVLTSHLNFFSSCLNNPPLADFGFADWSKFWEAVSQKRQSDWSASYASSVIKTVRSLFNWLADTEQINSIPRYVTSKMYSVTIPAKQPIPFAVEEIESIFSAATPQQRCYFLLMLNCGMTQKDLSELKPSMIDYKNGTLTRLRTKHEHQESKNIPTVRYHLWDCTFRYLKQYGNAKGELVFTNKAGKPLVGDNRNDSVAAGYTKIQKATGIKKTLKVFRKSGTSALGSSIKFKSWRETYLANTGDTTTDKHYDGTTELPREVTEFIQQTLDICNSVKKAESKA